MGKVLNYIVVNDIIIVKPTEFIREVSTQQDIEDLKPALEEKHNLPEMNKRVREHNKTSDSKKSEYKILFTIANGEGENLRP